MLGKEELSIYAKVEYCTQTTDVMIGEREALEFKVWHLGFCVLFAFLYA